jgi:hypothetical protein
MRRLVAICAVLVVAAAGLTLAQDKPAAPMGQKPPASPPADTSVTIGGKAITIKYSAPSVRGRDMFGPGGVISKDRTYPAWRLGANSATALHTEADLVIKGLAVPKGDYTLFAQVDAAPWQLIVNKQTGQWGLTYNKDQDLGRVTMDMSKPPSLIETCKLTLSSTGPSAGKLVVEFENFVASVPFSVK